MSFDRGSFLAAIDASPCDCTLRAIYADWLDENGIDPEEAKQQRRWKEVMEESKQWLTELAERLGGRTSYDDDYPPDFEKLTYEKLLAIMDEYVATTEDQYGGDLYHMGVNERYIFLYGEGKAAEFWKHYEIVTGKKAKVKGVPFYCSC